MTIKTNDLRARKNPIIGLALSGGGLRATTHIGVLKGLERNNIPIDMVAGTSAGAIVATMHACGYRSNEIQAIAENININQLIDFKISLGDLLKHGLKWMLDSNYQIWSALPKALIKGDKLERYFRKLWQSRTLRDTKIPLAIATVDMNSADTVFFTTPTPGNRFILNARYYHDALLSDAVRASIAIPGMFYPKKYRGMTLVDGAVKNNLPTDILRYMGADLIIGVDLGYNGRRNDHLDTVGEIILQGIDIMSREVTLLKCEQYADFIIRPDISYKDSKSMCTCITAGEQAISEKIPAIKRTMDRISEGMKEKEGKI
jgi:NTE family protein